MEPFSLFCCDGSLAMACPPLHALLEIMARSRTSAGHGLHSEEVRYLRPHKRVRGVKERWSLIRDPMMPVLIVYSFTAAIEIAATAMPDSRRKAAIAIVDEDQMA